METDTDNHVEDHIKDDHIRGWRWLFRQPDLGLAPTPAQITALTDVDKLRPSAYGSMLVCLMQRLTASPWRSMVMARANLYYLAGCPTQACEYAAARDLWSATHPQ
jgi:hypothetical protein